jgi:phosphoribosylglycinamide formyltransferase-1
MPAGLPRLAVLISGRGSNLQAIIDAVSDRRVRAEIALVISNVDGAPGLARAEAAGIPTSVRSHRQWVTRESYDSALAETVRGHGVDLVCLAGFMRLLSPGFIDAFPDRILNIHPSLLPSFPGLDAQGQAFEHGVEVTGVTVHFVNAQLDAGPIVLQTPVPVLPDDTRDTLAARILVEEHRAYPEAIQRVLDGGWRIDGRRFVRVALKTERP